MTKWISSVYFSLYPFNQHIFIRYNMETLQQKPTPLYFLLTAEETATRLQSSLEDGLKNDAVESLQVIHGPNELAGDGMIKWYTLLANQLMNGMSMILVAAFVVTLGISSYPEAGVIFAVIVLNVTVGYIQ